MRQSEAKPWRENSGRDYGREGTMTTGAGPQPCFDCQRRKVYVGQEMRDLSRLLEGLVLIGSQTMGTREHEDYSCAQCGTDWTVIRSTATLAEETYFLFAGQNESP
jgi:hypothetical protein